MARKKFSFSIKRIVLLLSGVTLFLSVSLAGALIFANWVNSANKTTEHIASNINEEIHTQVYNFIQVPYRINGNNQKIIENNMLNLTDEDQRNRFFVGVLEAQNKEIHSFTYGTAAGEYYGARRNEEGVIEIIKNDASTGSNSWYYSVNKKLTACELIKQGGAFDARTRPWYMAAVENGQPIFSPIYKHFWLDDLAVSAAWPIYNEAEELTGVLGMHTLLADIGSYLEEAVNEYNGIAIIVERSTGRLIANSMGAADFTVLEDGTMDRRGIEDIESKNIRDAYDQYKTSHISQEVYKADGESLLVNASDIRMDGIDWILISAIPKSTFMGDISNSIHLSLILTTVLLLGSLLVNNLLTRRYLSPMKGLLQASSEIAAGDLSKRAPVIRDDEIGLISKSFNNMTDTMQSFIENLEASVHERTEELYEATASLEEYRDELRLVLDSTAEAIYGIDLDGGCTFCNRSCIEILGYNDESDLLGKNIHAKIHHTSRDGVNLPPEECKVFKDFAKGQGVHVDDEVFWRSDGTYLDVEYSSYPQIKDGKVVGAVVTFSDISDRRKKEEKIRYLSCYDALTGLQNRRSFDESYAEIDTPENFPLSVIFADIDGLKMTNDIFGHAVGDDLIKKSSDILKRVCRKSDVISRVGGDEFIVLLPNTSRENAEIILSRIKSEFLDTRVKAVQCSISMGLDTKNDSEKSLEDLMTNAENAMYRDKTMGRESINSDVIDTLIETLHTRDGREKEHSLAVSVLCSEIGVALDFSAPKLSKLSRAGYLHDIGKIVLDQRILRKEYLSDEDLEKMRQHSATGYRILNLFDDTLDLAEYVYAHHERWDGTGYPRGLRGEETPLISRVIAVAEAYDRVVNRGDLPLEERELTALETIRENSGTQFDPMVVEAILKIKGQK